MKKYELLPVEDIPYKELYKKLYRVRALKNFGDVKEGDLGGYIESSKNLSHEGLCWVRDEAIVSGHAYVTGAAQICGHARVSVEAQVYGKAKVYGHAYIYDKARIYGEARVSGNARVYGHAQIYDHAQVYGFAYVYGEVKVYECAVLPCNIWHTGAITFNLPTILDELRTPENAPLFLGTPEGSKFASWILTTCSKEVSCTG